MKDELMEWIDRHIEQGCLCSTCERYREVKRRLEKAVDVLGTIGIVSSDSDVSQLAQLTVRDLRGLQ